MNKIAESTTRDSIAWLRVQDSRTFVGFAVRPRSTFKNVEMGGAKYTPVDNAGA